MPWINKEDISQKELNDLFPVDKLLKGVNYSKVEYYRDDNGKLYEYSVCIDGSLARRFKELESTQKKIELLESLGM